MKRRDFFKQLTTGAAGSLVALASEFPDATRMEDLPTVWTKFAHGGHFVWWTGWKGEASSATLVSQWTGWPAPMLQKAAHLKEGLGLYVCAPLGGEGEYHKGGLFDISVRDPKDIFTRDTPASVQFAAVSGARERLLQLIDDRNRRWPMSPGDVTKASQWLRTERL